MLIIPIIDEPSQTLNAQMAGQSCRINLYQKSTGFFCDLYVSDTLIVGGVICENLNRIVRSTYLGFTGDLMMMDTQGTDDPSTPGIGSRFLLCYLEASDLVS